MVSYEAFESTEKNWLRMNNLAGLTPSEQMLPLSYEKFMNNRNAIVAVDESANGRKVMGYIAQTALYDGRIAEVGSLIVDPAYRRKGHALWLVELATVKTRRSGAEAVIAYCNPVSSKVFQLADYEHLTFDKVPEKSLITCQECPKKCALEVGILCCDRAFIFTGAHANKVE